jgi:hypothetical protein
MERVQLWWNVIAEYEELSSENRYIFLVLTFAFYLLIIHIKETTAASSNFYLTYHIY